MSVNEVQRLDESYPNCNFHHSVSLWQQDIEYTDTEFGGVRGVCIAETKNTIVYLDRHENLADVVSTCVHETIHQCLSDIDDTLLETEWNIKQEHWCIQKILLAEETLSDYTSIINKETVRPKLPRDKYDGIMERLNKISDTIDECISDAVDLKSPA